MSHHGMHDQEASRGSFLTTRMALVLLGFIVITGLLLFAEHRAHVLGALLYLPLILCPLMHVFMHGGHGHGGHASDRRGDRERSAP